MSDRYEQAVAALYQAPHESFILERKRLAAELKGEGDKTGAATFVKLGRPTLSAWAVNQLWWRARESFDELFETADRLRKGELTASTAHRRAVAKLTATAQKLLSASGHATGDATLRRVTMTLTGLAASGGFAPEPPGALTRDRDPPGFEAFGIASLGGELAPAESPEKTRRSSSKAWGARRGPAGEKHATEKHATEKHAAEKHAADKDAAHKRAAAEAKRRAAEAEEARAKEAQRARREAKRRELEAAMRATEGELATAERARDRLAKELAATERLVAHTRTELEHAVQRLTALGD